MKLTWPRKAEPATSNRRLVVGLGNPGVEYRGTRHNVGFQVVECLADRLGVARARTRFAGELLETRGGGGPVLLLKPSTYMNRSGRSVAEAVHYYALELSWVMVVCDDFNLPLGRLRFRRSGSHGGQKGLMDIIARLGTDQFPRLRIGIAAPDGDAIDHVLGRFAPEEIPVINEAVSTAATAVEQWLASDIEAVMNTYNSAS